MVASNSWHPDLMGRLPLSMLNSIPFILLLGSFLGFLAGLGVGGGSLLIIWLTLVLEMTHSQARILNLLFFLPAAIITSLFRWKQGKLELKNILPGIVAGCVSAFIFSTVSTNLDTALLKKLFGILLLFTGLKELLYKPRRGNRS